MNKETKDIKIEISAGPLIQVLQAMSGPPHLIRELEVLRNIPGQKEKNPINILITEVNAKKDELTNPVDSRAELQTKLLACVAQLEAHTENDLIVGYDGNSFSREELKQQLTKGHS